MKTTKEILRFGIERLFKVKVLALLIFVLASFQLIADNETFSEGAYIIDMGANSQTYDNGIMPYGLVYELIMEENVPVRWAINQSKSKDGNDFSTNSKTYRGGSFIIPAEYLNADVIGILNDWEGDGVNVDGPISGTFTAPIYSVLTSWPRAVLDEDNGSIAEDYFEYAGIPEEAYLTNSNPSELTSCDDIYIMPHADPHDWDNSWSNTLINFVNNGGYLWAGCHAVSSLDGLMVPNAYFLSEEGLLHWDDHDDGNLNYTYDPAYDGDPIMQFIGTFDEATNKGSEQIYMPDKGDNWRSSTKIAVYQPNHTDADANEAALIAYGHAYGDVNKGMVMYQAAHRLDEKGSDAEQVAAIRAFFNFLLMTATEEEITVTSNVPSFVVSGSSINVVASGSDGSSPYTYEWTSSCDGGSFDDASAASTTYNAPTVGEETNCVITVKVTDNCGRFSYESTSVVVGPATGPTAVDDNASTPYNTAVDITVLGNDEEGDGALDPTSVTFVGGTAPPSTEGVFTVDETTGVVTFTPADGFVGTSSIDYSVCDANSLCDVATIVVVVDPQPEGPTAVDDNATTPLNTPVDIEALDNDETGDADLDPTSVTFVGGTEPDAGTEGVFTVNETTGLVTFTPVNGFTGTATIDYSVCDLNAQCDIATITVVIESDGPTAMDDDATTPINTPVDIDALDNDVAGDAELDPTTVTFVGGTEPDAGTEGEFTVDETTGLVTFTPVNGFTGTVTIDYSICDLNSQCAVATITVEISATGPTAIDDIAFTSLNTAVLIDVVDNDEEGDSALDPTTVSLVGGTLPNPTTEGVFTVDPVTGDVTFTPVTGFTGTADVDYEVCDVNGFCSIATITVGITTGTDTDGDGCTDDVDEYPNDPDRCFDIYYPANGNGTLAYEDLWPSKGDYDFNDLVVEYRFKTVTSGSNHIVETYATFVVKAFGAGFQNGFGFQLANNNISEGDILSVTGYDLQEAYVTLASNGLEQGQSIPTIIVYDNSYNIMEHPGQGIGVNTEPWAPYVTPDTLDMLISYTQGTYTYGELDIPNFNPFIMVNLERGVEVHLPNYPPTDLANEFRFGSWDDDSDPGNNRYYKTVSNLPWAIHIPEPFEWPIEKQDIIWVHLKFAEWAESGGSLSPDWYKDLPGYREHSLIYDQP